MTGRQKLVLGLFFLAFVVMIIGVVPWADLGIQRITALLVVPRDDGLVPPVRDPDRARGPQLGTNFVEASSTARVTCSASP